MSEDGSKTYKIIESWHGTGSCFTAELSPPLKGHKIVSQITWISAGGGMTTELFPGNREQANTARTLFAGTLEGAGYTK